jgi:hypothetical protein
MTSYLCLGHISPGSLRVLYLRQISTISRNRVHRRVLHIWRGPRVAFSSFLGSNRKVPVSKPKGNLGRRAAVRREPWDTRTIVVYIVRGLWGTHTGIAKYSYDNLGNSTGAVQFEGPEMSSQKRTGSVRMMRWMYWTGAMLSTTHLWAYNQ